MAKLSFNSTWTPAEFKAKHEVSKIDLISNDKTGKQFFATNVRTISGKVSSKIDADKPVAVSDCTDEDSGENFFMLHNVVAKANINATW